ncbi:putative N6-adenine methyltransferase-domain-containing protein [Xylaria nigripes]|nr:putative N6-adenine methyltransferase-domain-containing protein [Xylaria nigripes]
MDNDSLTLSADTLAALQEFYSERDAHAQKFEKLKARVENDGHVVEVEDDGETRAVVAPELSIHSFVEDWNESQFWYSDETANLLAKQLLDGTSDDSSIAVVSTPSVFVAIKKITAAAGYTGPNPKTYLLEHDNRFAVFPEFVFYDFAQPFKLPATLKGTVDRMICDPPFLSEDCQTKMAMTMRWLARATDTSPHGPRIIISTGERMASLITKLYGPQGVRITTYEPVHGGGLQNEFYCYANFECGAWRWRDGTEK